jgi:hypothetical protein
VSGRPMIDPKKALDMRLAGCSNMVIAEAFEVSKAAVTHHFKRKVRRRNKVRRPRKCLCGCGVLTQRRKYASRECYFRYVCKRPYVSWRQGQRIARVLVSQHFELRPGNVVHHVDGDNRNNALGNLWVFECHADHMSHHRGGLRKPIWKGSDCQVFVADSP